MISLRESKSHKQLPVAYSTVDSCCLCSAFRVTAEELTLLIWSDGDISIPLLLRERTDTGALLEVLLV